MLKDKKEEICSEENLEPIYIPAHDHRAIGFVERLIQTIKRQISCMRAHLKSSFTISNTCNYSKL